MTQQYDYESLGADEFQQLCQALLVKNFPNVQCFPVGMPDGGRDATSAEARIADAIVYQVKFRKPTPNKLATPDEICEWLEDHLEGEIPKVEALRQRGAHRYVVLTNAQCSSHLNAGTRDRMQQWLDAHMPIPSQVWWRDDIDRRLDAETDIKRTYGLLRDAVGLAELLGVIPQGAPQHETIRMARSDRRVSALMKYLRHQYERDRIVKFKQAELKPELLDVFVDVPVVPFNLYSDPAAAIKFASLGRRESTVFQRWDGLISQRARSTFAQNRTNSGAPAASFLLRQNSTLATKFVLEGAPGQGKSTVSQYVCQVHRARLLGLDDEVERFPPEHQSSPILLPFHVDLRDLSTWLRGEDPFNISNTNTPSGWANSLESFLAAQVRHDSGGMAFDVSDLDAVTSATPILLMLDGLDEVPDLNDRKHVVTAVNEAATRISYSCPLLLTVVTSRPSAFARTPGFSKKDYLYLKMADLPLSLVLEYTDGWLRSRDVPHQEAYDIRKVLGEKLGHPHIVDLARNPMQLAILLWLVNRKGLSLPDKRTALYGAYMDTFLDREAEKSNIVRDERDLILELHGYVAWELHCQAEVGKSRGSIAETKLKALLKKYLSKEDYETDLVDQLFSGMTQRVMVLTSRVQNTFEFEVQPLREYFAARYLYSTARTSPPGAERSGTRSDRFEALLRNPYWINVTRFYSGFSDKGELANIVDLLEDVIEDDEFSLISYPVDIATTLLRDQVFAQRPKSASRALELVTSEEALRVMLPSHTGGADRMDFSEGYGSYDLVPKLESRIERRLNSGFPDTEAAHVLSVNRSPADNFDWWYRKWQRAKTQTKKNHWFRLIRPLNFLRALEPNDLSLICKSSPSPRAFWQTVIDSGVSFLPRTGTPEHRSLDLVLRDAILEVPPSYYRPLRTAYEAAAYVTSRDYLERRITGYFAHDDLDKHVHSFLRTKRCDRLSEAILIAVREFVTSMDIASNIAIWQATHEALVTAYGEHNRATHTFALAAGNVRSGSVSRHVANGLLDGSKSAVLRARYARQRRNDAAWWSEQVQAVDSSMDAWFVLAAMLSWAPHETITAAVKSLERQIRDFSVEDLETLSAYRPMYRRAPRSHGEESDSSTVPRGAGHQALFILSLTNSSSAIELLEKATKRCADKEVAALYSSHRVQRLTIEMRDPGWGRLEELKEAHRASSHGFTRSSYYAPHRLRQATAREILRDPMWVPSHLVNMADQAVTGEVSRKAVPLAAVASRDNWFDD
ncbi:NACHT domain-containing protein [Streptomyces werraensis]|uniref:NACHT domain-containing protein n=1 Tax=Streptomyces werraensis TaxID=68284 RepID=UPI0037D7A5EE